jgi:hypothetical protein
MKRFAHLLVVMALLAGGVWTPAYGFNGYNDCAGDCVPMTYPCPGCYEEDSPPGEFIIMDALILRPLGLVSMAVGFAGAVVASPWGASSCSSHRIQQELLEKPYNYTFARRLGEEEFGPRMGDR